MLNAGSNSGRTGSMKGTASHTVVRTTSICLRPSAAAAINPSWRITSLRSTRNGIPTASSARFVFWPLSSHADDLQRWKRLGIFSSLVTQQGSCNCARSSIQSFLSAQILFGHLEKQCLNGCFGHTGLPKPRQRQILLCYGRKTSMP